MGKTHSLTGLVLWASIAPYATSDPLHLLGGALIAGVLPYGADLDHPDSTASRTLFGPFHRRLGKPFAKLVGGHRHGTHSLWACLIVAVALGAAATVIAVRWAPWLDVRLVALAGLLGWFGGILGDMLTKSRVHFLWPLSDRKVGIPLFTTGRLGEVVFNVGQLAAGAGMLYVHAGG